MTTATQSFPFYAVRVVLTFEDGSTCERDYVRENMRLSRDYFGMWALGNLLAFTSDGSPVAWTIQSLEPHEVRP